MSVLSTSSEKSHASAISTVSVASTSASSTSGNTSVSNVSDGSTSKLVHILGTDALGALSPEAVNTNLAPRKVIKAVLSKKLRPGKT